MKNTIALVAILLVSANAFALTCTSEDFNPKNYDGQQLKLSFDQGALTSAEIVEGSWGCAGTDAQPKLVAQNASSLVYSIEVDECSGFSYNSRIIVPKGSDTPEQVQFNFAYLTDDVPGHIEAPLSCK